MKMKEVCEATGLTERAVRLYCNEGLIEPERTEVRGRVYLEFAERHVEELRQIATLRAAGFSLEEIGTVLNEPHLIGELLEKLKARLMREQGAQTRVLEAIEAMTATPRDVTSLCTALEPKEKPRAYANGAALRGKGQSFRAFVESGTAAQIDADYREYHALERRIARGKVWVILIGIVYWIIAVGTLLINLSNNTALGGVLLFVLHAVIWIYFLRDVIWPRVVMAIVCFFEALFGFGMMIEQWPHIEIRNSYSQDGVMEQWFEEVGSWPAVAIFGGLALIFALGVYLIGFSRAVRDYLYERSTWN